ncbi:MAG: DUF4363 family protein [Oscillospiraceae bacterium]|nr:DUF4363 family protein [Oscillospiraceae bacterium]
MKNFIFSLSLAIILCSLVALNAASIRSACSELLDASRSLPSDLSEFQEKSSDECFNNIEDLLENYKFLFNISISESTLLCVRISFKKCREYYKSDDFPQYIAERAALIENLMVIYESDNISIKNIL